MVAVATLLLPRPEVPVVIYCSTFPRERQNLRIAVIYSSAFPLEQIAQSSHYSICSNCNHSTDGSSSVLCPHVPLLLLLLLLLLRLPLTTMNSPTTPSTLQLQLLSNSAVERAVGPTRCSLRTLSLALLMAALYSSNTCSLINRRNGSNSSSKRALASRPVRPLLNSRAALCRSHRHRHTHPRPHTCSTMRCKAGNRGCGRTAPTPQLQLRSAAGGCGRTTRRLQQRCLWATAVHIRITIVECAGRRDGHLGQHLLQPLPSLLPAGSLLMPPLLPHPPRCGRAAHRWTAASHTNLRAQLLLVHLLLLLLPQQ